MTCFNKFWALLLVLFISSCGYTLKMGKMQYIPDQRSGDNPRFYDPWEIVNGELDHTAVLEAEWVWNRTRRVTIDGHKIEYPGILIEPGKHLVEVKGYWDIKENVESWEAMKNDFYEKGYTLQSTEKFGKAERATFILKGPVLAQTVKVYSKKLTEKATISKYIVFEEGKKYHVNDFRD